MQLVDLVKKVPPYFQKPILKLLFLKNGKSLKGYQAVRNGEFYIYNVDNKYLPSENLSWFLDYQYYVDLVNSMSAAQYKPKKGDVIVDIGAGIGEEVIVFSDLVGEKGKIYSVEANPEVFEVLTKVIELNRFVNVHPFNFAINNRNENVEIAISQGTFLGSTIGSTEKSKVYSVTGKTFDQFIEENQIDRIDLLKVNIEGAERFVIESMSNSINRINNIAIACHDFRYKQEKEKNTFFITKDLVRSFLSNSGFEIAEQNTGVPYIDDWVYGKRRSML